MNIFSLMKAATLGNTRKLQPMIWWTVLEYAFRGAPYGILLMVVWELFKPLPHPGAPMNVTALFGYTIAFLAVLIILYFVSRIAYNKVYIGSYNICAEGRLAIGDHLRKLSMGFFNSRDPGVIGSYLINDYANIEFITSHLIPQMAGAVAMPLVMLIFMTFVDWQMALISALVIPVALPITFLTRRLLIYFGKKHITARMQAASRMLEYVQGMRLIKAFNLTGTKFDRMEKTFRRLKTLSIKLEAAPAPTMLMSTFILQAGFTLIILFGLTFMFAGKLSLPFYLMFLIIGLRVYEPLIQVLMFIGELNYNAISVQRIEELRKTPALTGTKPDMKPARFHIAFDNVSFRYHDTDVLKNVSITIPEQSLVAFVGPSGSGKTTMTRLISSLHGVSGRVFI